MPLLYPYNHKKIIGAIAKNRKFDSLLDRLVIGSVIHSETDTVSFDRYSEDLTIVPIMSPLVAGQLVERSGYETLTLRPTYTKPKMSIRFSDVIARKKGTPINSHTPNKVRYAQILKENAQILEGKISRMKTYMLAQMIKTGKIQMTGYSGGTFLLDFGRPASHTKVLAGGARWGESGVSEIDSLEDFIQTMNRPARSIVMGTAAWKLYREDPKFKNLINTNFNHAPFGKDTLNYMPFQFEEVLYRRVGHHSTLGVDIFVDATYFMINGQKVPVVDPYGVMVIPEPSLGIMGYGAIQDEAAKYQSYEIFYKTYATDDPGVPFVQAQTAPVPFHTDIEATGYMTVR